MSGSSYASRAGTKEPKALAPTETEPSAPVRVQLRRTKGWKMPPNTVKADRSTRWGNPWTPGDPGTVRIAMLRGGWDVCRLPMAVTRAGAVDRHRRWMRGEFTTPDGAIRMNHPLYDAVICDVPPEVSALRGKNLACWCALDAPCHADVLLEIANAPVASREAESSQRQVDDASPGDENHLPSPSGDHK